MTTLINLIFASPLNMVFFIIVEIVFFAGIAEIINALLSHTRDRHFIEFMEMVGVAEEIEKCEDSSHDTSIN